MSKSNWTMLVWFALAAGCASQQAEMKADAKKSEPKVERIALTNLSHFDLGACGPRSLDLTVVTPETLVGALLSAQPMFQECLVDSKARGVAEETKGTVKVIVSDAAVKYEVESSNLSPLGLACIEAAAKRLPLAPLAKGAKSVEGVVGIAHFAGKSPSVRMGVNVASDVIGSIRLAQPSWCSCYAPLRYAPPPSLKATLRLLPQKPLEVAFQGASEGAAEEPTKSLTACLEAKLKALDLPKVTSELQVPYPFAFVDAYAPMETSSAQAPIQFTQLDAIRNQRNADVAIRLGLRGVAASGYDAVVQKYKTKPNPGLIRELREKCQAVLDADDLWRASLKSLLETGERMVSLTQGLAAKDAPWAPALAGAQQGLARTQSDLAAADTQKQNDLAACPKNK